MSDPGASFATSASHLERGAIRLHREVARLSVGRGAGAIVSVVD